MLHRDLFGLTWDLFPICEWQDIQVQLKADNAAASVRVTASKLEAALPMLRACLPRPTTCDGVATPNESRGLSPHGSARHALQSGFGRHIFMPNTWSQCWAKHRNGLNLSNLRAARFAKCILTSARSLKQRPLQASMPLSLLDASSQAYAAYISGGWILLHSLNSLDFDFQEHGLRRGRTGLRLSSLHIRRSVAVFDVPL